MADSPISPHSQAPIPVRPSALAACLLVLVGLVADGGLAATKWIGGSGTWDDPTAWSPSGPPVSGDVNLMWIPGDATITYRNAVSPPPALGFLAVDGFQGGSVTLAQPGDALAVSGESVGINGNAAVVQSGGSHSVASSLSLGLLSGSHGSYDLSGSGVLSADVEVVGDQSLGTFTQSGGSNTATTQLVLGVSGGSGGFPRGFGTYALSGTGAVLAGNEVVGASGTGTFTQSGGTNTVTDRLVLGEVSNYYGTGYGSYELSAGDLDARFEAIGQAGAGLFTHSGGSNTVTQFLRVGGASRYVLSGTGTLSALSEGLSGTTAGLAHFDQSGGENQTSALTLNYGTYALSGGSLNTGRIVVGTLASFDFTGGRLSVETFYGDLANNGGILAPGASPGTTSIHGNLSLDASGVLEIEIGSPVPGTGYDTVTVTGTATLGGILDVSLLGSFAPAPGETFDILSAQTILGTFDIPLLPTFGGYTFAIDYLLDPFGTDRVQLTALPVPEPASALLAAVALLAMARRGPRRRNTTISSVSRWTTEPS